MSFRPNSVTFSGSYNSQACTRSFLFVFPQKGHTHSLALPRLITFSFLQYLHFSAVKTGSSILSHPLSSLLLSDYTFLSGHTCVHLLNFFNIFHFLHAFLHFCLHYTVLTLLLQYITLQLHIFILFIIFIQVDRL